MSEPHPSYSLHAGLYTAASDDALAADLLIAKSLGFNAVRKHMKAETERWYYHADRCACEWWCLGRGGAVWM
jgi:hypothetical protein